MTAQSLSGPGRTLRALEFAALYIAAPLTHLIFFEQLGLFGPLVAIAGIAVLLLAITPGFSWRELIDFSAFARWRVFLLIYLLAAAGIVAALVLALVPHRLLEFPARNTQLWATIMVLYPLVSVLGQEIFFRKLFFRRYAELFASSSLRILVNGGVFALAHVFYQNAIAVGLTALAGLVFAWAYERSRSFPLVVVLHSLGGQAVFTLGLGIYFYHGAIG